MDDNPQWYKDAVIYQLHVRAYRDSDADGIGDFRGLIEKLDYLQDLGVTAIWLLPFYPSPLKDDGYDIADYTTVHASYGTVEDLQALLREAHARDLRVITELVLNHTSDKHAWFQRARKAPPGSSHRDFYVWSDTPDKYRDARIIFKDFESSNWSWDPEVKAYYWHRFYSHQPDLNFENPAVHEELRKVVDMWLEMGVDGLRLDAVPYLYEREGTNCENLPETHAFLKSLRAHIDEKFPNRMLLAEANQWPEDAIAYFGDGDECEAAFHFPVMPRLFMALQMEDRFPVIDIMAQTPPIPENCQWFVFLRNHDELTLEMVTDEERDYMYRVYAHDPQARINLGIRRRLAPLLGNNRRKIELLNGLLLSLPGTPVVYYGDEIGMGDNIYLGDRNGVRTPMQWNADRNAGFSHANAQRLYFPVIIDPEYHYEAVNVETQQNNPQSLLWWMKRLISLRQKHRAFGRGTLEFLYPQNRKVLAYLRRFEEETILVVVNLSRFSQYVELDLAKFKGTRPVELFGQSKFPPIGDLQYLLTLGPHSFYWFSLKPGKTSAATERDEAGPPELRVPGPWEWSMTLRGRIKTGLEAIIRESIVHRRWFGGKARTIQTMALTEIVPIGEAACFASLHIDYVEGEGETYLLPLGYAHGAAAERIAADPAAQPIATLKFNGQTEPAVLYDAFGDESLHQAMLDIIAGQRHLRGQRGQMVGARAKNFDTFGCDGEATLKTNVLKGEQSNSSVIFGDRFILKLFRKLEEGINPDLEIGLYLSKVGFTHTAPVAGSLEYRLAKAPTRTLAILQRFVPNEGDAWRHTLDDLGRYFERVLAQSPGNEMAESLSTRDSLFTRAQQDIPEAARELIGPYIQDASLLGRRTAEMHIALSLETEDKEFVPEPFTQLFQRSFYQQTRSQTAQTMQLLRQQLERLPGRALPLAERVLSLESKIQQRFAHVTGRKISALRIRCHGDYHLGQVLFTGKDFVIIDFEGEPAKPLSDRRIKRSPLRDVAGMIRSFHYAVHAALEKLAAGGIARDSTILENWGRVWYLWVSTAFLKSYREVAGGAPFLPQSHEELELQLDAYLLDKAVYELKYELNNRPDWVSIPLHAIEELIAREPAE